MKTKLKVNSIYRCVKECNWCTIGTKIKITTFDSGANIAGFIYLNNKTDKPQLDHAFFESISNFFVEDVHDMYQELFALLSHE